MVNPKSPSERLSELVKVNGLHAGYRDKRVLEDMSFSIHRGEIFVIMGGSGSGKTTLFRHLIGLQRPLRGQVSLLGVDLTECDTDTLFEVRKKIGVAFQGGALINSMSVIDNIELPLRQHTKLDSQTVRIMSRMKLEMMALDAAERMMPAELSGGMLKRAGLARAVIMDPEILFFDEPSAGLDPATGAELDELIIKLRDALSMTIVVVTHDLDSALKIADRILIVANRGIAALGTVDEIELSPDPHVQSLLARRVSRTRMSGDEYIDHLTNEN